MYKNEERYVFCLNRKHYLGSTSLGFKNTYCHENHYTKPCPPHTCPVPEQLYHQCAARSDGSVAASDIRHYHYPDNKSIRGPNHHHHAQNNDKLLICHASCKTGYPEVSRSFSSLRDICKFLA